MTARTVLLIAVVVTALGLTASAHANTPPTPRYPTAVDPAAYGPRTIFVWSAGSDVSVEVKIYRLDGQTATYLDSARPLTDADYYDSGIPQEDGVEKAAYYDHLPLGHYAWRIVSEDDYGNQTTTDLIPFDVTPPHVTVVRSRIVNHDGSSKFRPGFTIFSGISAAFARVSVQLSEGGSRQQLNLFPLSDGDTAAKRAIFWLCSRPRGRDEGFVGPGTVHFVLTATDRYGGSVHTSGSWKVPSCAHFNSRGPSGPAPPQGPPCTRRVLGAKLYNLTGVSCGTARRVYLAYRGGSLPQGWSCSATERTCDGSGLSIDEWRSFQWRF